MEVEARDTMRRVASTGRRGVETAARVGYAAKGAVYLGVGALALRSAFLGGEGPKGSRGALREMLEAPFGRALLAMVALGLLAYAVWRFVQAGADVEDDGSDAGGTAKRLGRAGSGVVYLSLSVYAVGLATGLALGGSGDSDGAQTWTAKLLAQPFGPLLVGLAGAVTAVVAVHQLRRARSAEFAHEYDASEMSARQRRVAVHLGQFGIGARAVVFGLMAVFLFVAAWRHDADEARGLQGTLETLAAQPYGPWLLGLVGAGLFAYGAYCFSRARYRRIAVH